MDLSDLRAEVQARGFDFATNARLNYWINNAYHRVCDRQAWDFLETTTTGSSPLTISDVRAVLSVVDTTNENVLEWEDYRTLREGDPAMDQTGNPYCWYLSDPTTLATYPTTSVSLSVRYVKHPAALDDDADEPVIPERYQYMLVDGAVAYAYRDSDNFEAADATEVVFERAIQEMADATLVPNYDNPASIAYHGGSTDW